MNKLKTRKPTKHPHGNRLSCFTHNIIAIMILSVIITMTGCSLIAAVAGIASANDKTDENSNAKTNENANAKNQSRSAKTNKNANAKANENVNANKQPGTNSSQTKDPFISAIINGQTDAVKQQLAAGANVNAKAKVDDATPLHYAANLGHADIVKALIGAGADVNAKNIHGATPLYEAAGNGHADAVKVLIAAGADVNAKTLEQELTPLSFAANKGHTDIVKALIAAGADVNAKASGDATPLHIAAGVGHADIVNELIAAGADINAKTLDERTPLHAASEEGHADAVKELIAAGADINAKDIHGGSPLHFAAFNGHADIVKDLINAGADINAMSKEGYTPIYAALLSKLGGNITPQKYDDVVKELRSVNDKIDFETNNKDFETALNNFRAQIDTCTDIGKPTREIVEEFISRDMLLCGEPLAPTNWETRRKELEQKCLSDFFTLCPDLNGYYSHYSKVIEDIGKDINDTRYYKLFTNYCKDELKDYISGKVAKLRPTLYEISQKVVIVDIPDVCHNSVAYFYQCFSNATIPDVLKTIKDIQDPDSEIRRNVEKKKRTKAYADEVERMYQDSTHFGVDIPSCEHINILSYNESQQLPIIYGYCNGILAAREGSIQTPNPITPEIILTGSVPSNKYIDPFRSCINRFSIFHDDYVTSKDYFLKRLQKDQDDYSQEASKIRKNKAAYDKKVNECANLCLLKNKPGSNSYYACMSTCMRAL